MAEIKVFSTPTCPHCIKLKEYLKQKNLDFENFDVASDKDALDYMIKLTGQMGVPVTVIDGNAIVGFDKEKINSALNIS
ncbi:MAG: glutaredoxin domain-containing protein [Candidatus Omnitrophota bacterium]